MTPALTPEAKEAVVNYLSDALPQARGFGEDGWEDMAMTPWQFGCMALDALGVSEERQWGSARLEIPRDDLPTPRWDDIARVVLTVLSQRREITYRLQDGSVYEPPPKEGQFQIKIIGADAPVPPLPNIAAAHGAGPAYAKDEHLSVLQALGLVGDREWMAEAELVHWRQNPREWGMSYEDDPRFIQGLARCVQTMPQEVVEEMSDLAEITSEEITAAVERTKKANAELVAKYPAQARFDRTVTREGEFRGLKLIAAWRMDDLFFAGWRLLDGWLGDVARQSALPLFRDPLAQRMRAAALAEMGLVFPQEMPL